MASSKFQFAAMLALVGGLLGLLPLTADAQDRYRIRPGDVLQIEVIEDPGLSREVLVSPDGRITLPLAGVVRAAGRTVEEVQADLVARLTPNFVAPPNVFVGIGEVAERPDLPEAEPPTVDIYIIGEVVRPGRVSVAPGTTLLQALAEMGGFSRFAALRRLQLRRTDRATGREAIYPIDYTAIEEGRSSAGTVTLRDGDVIVVPQRELFE